MDGPSAEIRSAVAASPLADATHPDAAEQAESLQSFSSHGQSHAPHTGNFVPPAQGDFGHSAHADGSAALPGREEHSAGQPHSDHPGMVLSSVAHSDMAHQGGARPEAAQTTVAAALNTDDAPMPAELRARLTIRVHAILAVADLETVTGRAVRKQLEAELGFSLAPHKRHLNDLINTVLLMVAKERGLVDDDARLAAPPAAGVSSTAEISNETDVAEDVKGKAKFAKSPKLVSTTPPMYPSAAPPATSRKKTSGLSAEVIIDSDDEDEFMDGADEDRDHKLAIKLQQAEKGHRVRRTRASSSSTTQHSKRRKTRPTSRGGGGGGFSKSTNVLSPELARVVGATSLPRTQVVKRVWDYIKAHNLQNPNDKREIICDDALTTIFKRSKVTMFSMNKYLGAHMKAAVDVVGSNGDDSDDETDDFSGSEADAEYSDNESRGSSAKKARRKTSKAKSTSSSTRKSKKSGPKGGFSQRLMQLSEPLAKVCGEAKLPRTQVVKKLWEYVREHNLQNPNDKREIICDDDLYAVFGRRAVTGFSMNKYIGAHLSKIEDDRDGVVPKVEMKDELSDMKLVDDDDDDDDDDIDMK